MAISNGVQTVQFKKSASQQITTKATPPGSAKMKRVDEFMYADGPKAKKPKAVVPGSVTARTKTTKKTKKQPAHVVTVKSVVADIAEAAKNSSDPKVQKTAKAVLQLMTSFEKKPPKSASAKDKKAVRALWWIFSNPALSEKKKKERIIKLIGSEEFDNPVIRSAILIALASKWGIQLFTGKCRRVPARTYSKTKDHYELGRCFKWEWKTYTSDYDGKVSRFRECVDRDKSKSWTTTSHHSVPAHTSCSFKNTWDLKTISRIARRTRVSPVEHSAYLSLNKHVAQYIKASVEHFRREAKKKVFFDRAMARIQKKKYAKRTARYCSRRPRKCVTLKLKSGTVQVKKRSSVYKDLIKSGYVKKSK